MIKIHLPTAYPAQDVPSLALTRIPREHRAVRQPQTSVTRHLAQGRWK